MALTREKIEHFLGGHYMKEKSGYRKWLKKQMNKWLRMHPDVLKRKYKGYEY